MENEKARLDRLMEEYKDKKAGLTAKEKAQFESDIWHVHSEIHGTGVSKIMERRDWFPHKFGGKPSEYADRCNLLGGGIAVDVLWGKLQNGMSIRSALHVFRRAKNRRGMGEGELDVLIEEELKSYEGKKYIKPEVPFAKRAKAATPLVSPQDYFQRIKALSEEFADMKLIDVDPYLADQAKQELLDWIKEGYESLLYTAGKLRKEGKNERLGKIGKTRFVQACEVLGITTGLSKLKKIKGELVTVSHPIKFGELIDLQMAKRNKFKRARELHPDSNAGSHASQEEYQAVIEAYEVLEDYMRQVEKNKK